MARARMRIAVSFRKVPAASRPTFSGGELTTAAVAGQFTFARWLRDRRKLGAATRSVGGIDRANATAVAIGARIAAGIEKGVGHASEKPARSGGLALRVARVGAVAETRSVPALHAKRIVGADGRGRRDAGDRKPASGQQSQNQVTHENLLGRSRTSIDSVE